MKMKSLRSFGPSSGHHRLMILALLVIALILLIPNGGTLADSNAPTVTNTPEATETPIPEVPTQEPTGATSTPVPIIPTEVESNAGEQEIITPPISGNAGRLSTLNRILLALLAIVVVIVVGVIVYIFIHQTRGGLEER